MRYPTSLSPLLCAFLLWSQTSVFATSSDGTTSAARLTEAKGFIYKRGFVDWNKEVWGSPQQAHVGDVLDEGMQIGTGNKSWAQLAWKYITTRAWANSVYAIAPNQRLVYLVAGEMLFHLDKNRKDKEEYYVWTNLLQARIRGTTVLVQSFDDKSRISVLEGTIDVMNRSDKSIIRLKPGVVYEVKSKDALNGNAQTQMFARTMALSNTPNSRTNATNQNAFGAASSAQSSLTSGVNNSLGISKSTGAADAGAHPNGSIGTAGAVSSLGGLAGTTVNSVNRLLGSTNSLTNNLLGTTNGLTKDVFGTVDGLTSGLLGKSSILSPLLGDVQSVTNGLLKTDGLASGVLGKTTGLTTGLLSGTTTTLGTTRGALGLVTGSSSLGHVSGILGNGAGIFNGPLSEFAPIPLNSTTLTPIVSGSQPAVPIYETAKTTVTLYAANPTAVLSSPLVKGGFDTTLPSLGLITNAMASLGGADKLIAQNASIVRVPVTLSYNIGTAVGNVISVPPTSFVNWPPTAYIGQVPLSVPGATAFITSAANRSGTQNTIDQRFPTTIGQIPLNTTIIGPGLPGGDGAVVGGVLKQVLGNSSTLSSTINGLGLPLGNLSVLPTGASTSISNNGVSVPLPGGGISIGGGVVGVGLPVGGGATIGGGVIGVGLPGGGGATIGGGGVAVGLPGGGGVTVGGGGAGVGLPGGGGVTIGGGGVSVGLPGGGGGGVSVGLPGGGGGGVSVGLPGGGGGIAIPLGTASTNPVGRGLNLGSAGRGLGLGGPGGIGRH